MGLDKRKRILIVDDFEFNPFNIENAKLSIINKSSLPTLENDVILDRYENVHYSVQYVLNRLLDNDKFIQQYLTKTKQFIESPAKRLSVDLSSHITSSNIASSTHTSNGIYKQYLDKHLDEYHKNILSIDEFCYLSTVAENYLKNDMSNFDEEKAKNNFQKNDKSELSIELASYTDITISNDVVVDIEFDDSDNVRSAVNYVAVYALNENTDYQFRTIMSKPINSLETLPDLTQCKYIYKQWLSGFKELYIYLPTTFTSYHEHLPYEYGNENPAEHPTFIKVAINRRHFKFNHIYQAHINGQSLPMHIHADKNPYFSDIILPSMLRSMCIGSDNNNTDIIYDERTQLYYLYFVCYGTDAQAIRIFGD